MPSPFKIANFQLCEWCANNFSLPSFYLSWKQRESMQLVRCGHGHYMCGHPFFLSKKLNLGKGRIRHVHGSTWCIFWEKGHLCSYFCFYCCFTVGSSFSLREKEMLLPQWGEDQHVLPEPTQAKGLWAVRALLAPVLLQRENGPSFATMMDLVIFPTYLDEFCSQRSLSQLYCSEESRVWYSLDAELRRLSYSAELSYGLSFTKGLRGKFMDSDYLCHVGSHVLRCPVGPTLQRQTC